MRLRPGLRSDRDDRCHHLPDARGSRPRRPAFETAALGRAALRPCRAADRRHRVRRRSCPSARSAKCGPVRTRTCSATGTSPTRSTSVLSEDGWFRTGDAGWLDAEGYLFLHDRIKDMIVTGGENVYPAEVENALTGPSGRGRCRRHRRARRQVGRDGQGHRGEVSGALRQTTRTSPRTSSPPPAIAWPTTSARPRSTSSTCCPATPRARSSSGSFGVRTGTTGNETSTEGSEQAGRRLVLVLVRHRLAGDHPLPLRMPQRRPRPARWPRGGGPVPLPASGYAADDDRAHRRFLWPVRADRPAGRHR